MVFLGGSLFLSLPLFLFPLHSPHVPLFLSFPPCFYFYFFLSYPCPSPDGSPRVHIRPFAPLHSLLPPLLPPPLTSGRGLLYGVCPQPAHSVIRLLPTGQSNSQGSAARAYAEAFCLALNRWNWAETEFEGQLKWKSVSEVCIPFRGVGGGKGGCK